MKEAVTLESHNKTLVVKLTGDPTPEQIEEVLNKTRELTKGMDKVNLLTDIQGLKNIPQKARRFIARDIPTPIYEKLAVFGTSTRLRVLGTLVLKMLPQVKETRFFATETQARKWLKEERG
jgi:hypothetical protein